MVAYSFKAQFAEPIIAGIKRQTIRADRKRHARLGERLQLYVGMRTKHCRKIISDPVCIGIESVQIYLDEIQITSIAIDGVFITGDVGEAFAKADGFASVDDMHNFWLVNHGAGEFHGVIIRWGQP